MKIYDAKEGKALEWSERDRSESLKKYIKVSDGWRDTYDDAVHEMVVQNTSELTGAHNTIIDAVAYSEDDEDLLAEKQALREEIFDLHFVENWNRYSEKGVRYDGTIGTLWEIVR